MKRPIQSDTQTNGMLFIGVSWHGVIKLSEKLKMNHVQPPVPEFHFVYYFMSLFFQLMMGNVEFNPTQIGLLLWREMIHQSDIPLLSVVSCNENHTKAS